MKLIILVTGLLASLASASLVQAQTGAAPRMGAVPAKPKPRRLNMEPIDFTPRIGELRYDGLPRRVILLNRGEDRIAMLQSAPWIVSGSREEIVFTATEFPQARITLRRSALPRPPELDDAWAVETSNLILRSLPADSRRALREKRSSPLVVNDWKSTEISVAFDQFGGRFVRGYVFVLTPRGELLELIVGAREQDFTTVRDSAVSILASWQEMTAQQYSVYRSEGDTASAMPSPARPAASPAATPR